MVFGLLPFRALCGKLNVVDPIDRKGIWLWVRIGLMHWGCVKFREKGTTENFGAEDNLVSLKSCLKNARKKS